MKKIIKDSKFWSKLEHPNLEKFLVIFTLKYVLLGPYKK